MYLSKKIDKACFPHDVACGDFKDLNRRTAVDKVLRDKAFNIAKNPKYEGYVDFNVDVWISTPQWFLNFLIKKLVGNS